MNFGSCPYEGCEGSFMLGTPERTPAYAKVICDSCGRTVVYRFSRLDPQAFTEEGFAEYSANRKFANEAGVEITP